MNQFSIIILRFFYVKISRNYDIFQKILKKFQPPPPTERKKLKFLSRRHRLLKRFLAAAAEERKKLKIFSRRERRRLTPLFAFIK
jgi:hypothetical protein